MTKRERLIYLAGFLDGDGHFYKPMTVNGRGVKKRYTRVVGIQAREHKGEPTNVLGWCKKHFGGSVHWYPSTNNGRWSLQGKGAVELIGELLPYLIVKKQQATDAL